MARPRPQFDSLRLVDKKRVVASLTNGGAPPTLHGLVVAGPPGPRYHTGALINRDKYVTEGTQRWQSVAAWALAALIALLTAEVAHDLKRRVQCFVSRSQKDDAHVVCKLSKHL